LRAAALLLLLLASVAHAEEARKVWHDATEMVLRRADDNGIEIAYGADVPQALREIGVTTGTMLIKGQWEDDILIGQAWAFSKDCGPISYAIRGVVTYGGALIVFGPVPTSCNVEDYEHYSWGKEAIMRFDMPPPSPHAETVKGKGKRSEQRESKPERPKPKAKPAPPPRPKPRAAPRPTYQQPQWPSYPQQWRW
jgi:hypothetical protein